MDRMRSRRHFRIIQDKRNPDESCLRSSTSSADIVVDQHKHIRELDLFTKAGEGP